MTNGIHVAVMTSEAVVHLQPLGNGRYIDATLGAGTHTEALLKASSPNGRVLSIDANPLALERSRAALGSYGKRWIGVEANFRNLESVAKENGFAPCDGILFDLGLSSDELADPSKGFSFTVNGPLDMRLGPSANEDGLTAAEIVNGWSRDEIEQIVRTYGEERYSRKIADAIVGARAKARLIGTLDLASVIRSAVPRVYERGRIHPATRTFQALRIAVNDELNALRDAIKGARAILSQGARVVIISFHSLEDRIVKQAFRDAEGLTVITKKPISPSDNEIAANPRSRSAKMRVAEKT